MYKRILKKSIVLDNIIFRLQDAGGVSNYWFNLLKRISGLYLGRTFYYEAKNSNIFRRNLEISTLNDSSLPLSRYLPFLKKLPKYSIFHSSYYRVSTQQYVANITTIHDFTYEFFSSGIKQRIHTWQKNFAIRHSSGIICVSENTKSDLLNFLPDIDESRLKVIYNGVSQDFYPIENSLQVEDFFNLVGKVFVLFVGDRSPYKNFDKAVDVVKNLPDINLVIVGGKNFTEGEISLLSALDGRFYAYRGVDNVALNWLYNHAFCLLYPSSYEGFGIPILEAMRAGCPVVSTNLSSIPEVAGEAALLVDSPSTDLLLGKVNALFDLETRDEFRRKGFQQAAKFSWDKCFDETIAFYDEVWERKFGG